MAALGKLLVGDCVRLRSFELEKDEAVLYQWENDTTAWTSSGTLNPLSSSFIKEFITRSAASIVEEGRISLVVEVEQVQVGYVQLLDYDPINRKAGVGVYIAPEYRSRGYAHEALRLLSNYAYAKLGCEMLYASVLSNNFPSLSLFKALGFEHTATLLRWVRLEDEYCNLFYFQLWRDKAAI